MGKSVIIIGAGMGGMSAGIYGQMNGLRTRIYEMHTVPGGQCTSWKRKGYTFDVCIHHLMGCSPENKVYRIWSDTGAAPFKLHYSDEHTTYIAADGKKLEVFYDPDKLERQLLELAPEDAAAIRKYIRLIKTFSKGDMMGDLMLGGLPGLMKQLPRMLKSARWMKATMAEFAGNFTNPFLKRVFPLLVYTLPEAPLFLHLSMLSSGFGKDIGWPEGGSAAFASSMAKRYEELGGHIEYGRKVTRIITRNNTAVGVGFADGSEEYADVIVSNADGRKTLKELLEGRYMSEKLEAYCEEKMDETNWAVHVFLGVNRDLTNEPFHKVLLLDRPVVIAGYETSVLQLSTSGRDTTMAPEGKGVIKVELVSKYSYWKDLYQNRSLYEEEKKRVADQVITLLENHYRGIREQIEVIDVPTLLTWERFMGGTRGFINFPAKKMSVMGSLSKNKEMTIPGLKNFYFTGVWTTSAGALFANAISGKRVAEMICRGKA